MKTTSIALLSTLCLATACTGQALDERLRHLDGVLSDQEQAMATQTIREDAATLFVREEGGVLTVGVKTEPLYVASLCLATPSTVLVLHASAALGGLAYSRQGDGWNPSGDFAWAVRDTGMTDAALAVRRQYFDEHGWVATTMEMGRPGEVEFFIRRDVLSAGDVFIAAGLMPGADPDAIIGLPAASAGDCADAELVGGTARHGLDFKPGTWAKLSGH